MDPTPRNGSANTSALALEQGRVDGVHLAAEEEIESIRQRLDGDPIGNRSDTHAWAETQRSRLHELEAADPALCLGRFDTDDEVFYVGRCGLEADTPDGARVTVVSWKAPIASRYYDATADDPRGLVLRRRFDLDDDLRTIRQLEEDRFGADAAEGELAGPTFEDLVLRQLTAERSGSLRDIVATIHADQNRIIRLPGDQVVVIHGGPGTGKTAVGLHRLSYLLYSQSERLRPQDVLVVGPNRVFLEYARSVLPSLGDDDVRSATPAELAVGALPRGAQRKLRTLHPEPRQAAALKGDARLAEVIGRAAQAAISVPPEGLRVGYRGAQLQIDAAAIEHEIRRLRRLGAPLRDVRKHLMDGRRRVETGWVEDQLWTQYVRTLSAWDRLYGKDGGRGEFASSLRGDAGLVDRLNEIVRVPDPVDLVRRLLTQWELLEECSSGVLDDAERLVLHGGRRRQRGRKSTWSEADLALVDEAAAQCTGVGVAYGHIVVDEAQDLSAMAARMVARRSRTGAMTVLGDPAQTTSAAGVGSWDELLEHLAPGASATWEALTTTYRVPEEILAFAQPAGEAAAPNARPPVSIRTGGQVHQGDTEADLERAVGAALGQLGTAEGLVGVITPASTRETVRSVLAAAEVPFTEAPAPIEGAGAYLVPAELAKGLEFDHTIVVEPRAIVEEGDRGPALLFVALTRATKSVVLARARELPVVLGGPVEEPPRTPPPPPRDERDLRARLAGVEADNERLRGDLAALEAERDRLSAAIAALQPDNERLRRELAELREQVASTHDELVSALAGLARVGTG